MAGLIRPLFSGAIRHLARLVREEEYFTYHRLVTQLRRTRRYQPFNARVHGWKLQLPDAESFLSTYQAVFVDKIYAFAFQGAAPRILDLGANVGLSVLFFKKTYPQAQITAFEPDPAIFAYLESNVRGNGYSDVELVCKAAWVEEGRLPFTSRGDDAGSLAAPGTPGTIEVEAIDLAAFLQGRAFDFIKMDIEGAERVVLPACRPYLKDLPYLFVEYHSEAGKPQALAEVVGTLADAGFRLSIKEVWGNPQPLLKRRVNLEGYDFQANIFAWREGT